ncbi:hypothetical protein B0H13DRAFT_2668283 [Mycena leptocephala]|nr:hypothetical protein B0H13DRAFT_2668283 [Mycena leptocephala]
MLYGHQFTSGALLVPLTIVCYDHLLNFDSEIEFVWRRPKRLSSFLFIALRYGSLLSNVTMIFLRALMIIELEMFCIGPLVDLFDYLPISTRWNKIVLLFLIAAGLVAVSLGVWSIVGGSWVLATSVPGCVYPVSKQSALRMAGAWEAEFLCDLLVFLFTVLRAYRQTCKVPGSVLSFMARDGALYFAGLAVVNLGNIMMYHFGNPWTAASLSWFTSTLSVTMVSRLMLRLHKFGDEGIMTGPGLFHEEPSLRFITSNLAYQEDECSIHGEE